MRDVMYIYDILLEINLVNNVVIFILRFRNLYFFDDFFEFIFGDFLVFVFISGYKYV